MNIEPFAGLGISLRRDHYDDFLRRDVPVDFVEIISENYLVDGGNPLHVLDWVRASLPVAMHGVSLSIGSVDGLDLAYLARLRALAERIEPLWVSDHLCWTRSSAHNSHDLLPLPYTEEALDLVCDHVDQAQQALRRPLVLENPSSYLRFPGDEMPEWEFIARMTARSGCYLLLDLNNVFVSACNHGFSTADYLAGLPLERVRQVHLAGHSDGPIKIDTHDQPVCDEVWRLYANTCRNLGEVATMIERDDRIPPLDALIGELDQARVLQAAAQSTEAA